MKINRENQIKQGRLKKKGGKKNKEIKVERKRNKQQMAETKYGRNKVKKEIKKIVKE